MATRSRASRAFFVVLVVVSVVLVAVVIAPFASALFLAAVLAGVFHGWHVKLARRLWNRPSLSASLLTVAVLLALILPLGVLLGVVVAQGIEAVNGLSQVLRTRGLRGVVDGLPSPLRSLAARGLAALPNGGQDLVQSIAQQSGRAVAAVGGFLSATSQLVLQTVMMLIAFFFLLVDGKRLLAYLDRIVPLEPGQFRQLMTGFRRVARAVLVSTVGTAGVQSVAAGIGFFIAGVPSPLFFVLVTFFLAFIPAVGAASVPVVLALSFFVGGKTGWGIFLLAWGVLVVGLIDNVVKPLLIKGGLELHGGVVFFALLGGLAAFGAVGLAAGPMIVAFFVALTQMRRQDGGSAIQPGS